MTNTISRYDIKTIKGYSSDKNCVYAYLGPELNGMKAKGSMLDDTPPFRSKRSGLNTFGSGNTDGLRNATKSVRARLESAGIIRPSSTKIV